MATKEKMHSKSNIGKIDMNMVNELKHLQKIRNCQLQGCSLRCFLHPDYNKLVCRICPSEISKICFKYEWERNYIHNQEKASSDRQIKKEKEESEGLKSNQEYNYDGFDSYEDYDDYYDDDDNDPNDEAKKYPCGEMYFACPEKDECHFGKECQYSPIL